jgi:hypothetical protein
MATKKFAFIDAWSPMDTAPRDGTEILCFTLYGDCEITHWLPVAQCWVSKRGILVEASHWRPLPELPPLPRDRTPREQACSSGEGSDVSLKGNS